MKLVLHVGNKNYSSWSMRPWLALRWAGLAFDTVVHPLGGDGYGEGRTVALREVSPTGRVPVLRVDDELVYDSLAICEWAAEQNAALWPREPMARALARSAASEMHTGFTAIRETLGCNVRRRAEPRTLGAAVLDEVARTETLWAALQNRFGTAGGYLFGAEPTIADAFFTPLATRFRTYAVPLSPKAQTYVDTLLGNAEFLEWERDAEAEAWTIPSADAL